MAEYVEVWTCDDAGMNCTGPTLEPLTRWEDVILPEWLDVTHPFYQDFFEVTALMLVLAICVRLAGKFALYT